MGLGVMGDERDEGGITGSSGRRWGVAGRSVIGGCEEGSFVVVSLFPSCVVPSFLWVVSSLWRGLQLNIG